MSLYCPADIGLIFGLGYVQFKMEHQSPRFAVFDSQLAVRLADQ